MKKLLLLLFAVLPAAAEVRLGDARRGGVRTISDEDYVAAVAQAEVEPGWPAEALKVQTVVARTYMRKNQARHRAEGFDFCDLAHCQVYRGPAGEAAREAARATSGEILAVEGRPADAVFHAVCGGRTAAAGDVWPEGRSGLPGVSDDSPGGPWCRRSPDFAWTVSINGPGLAAILLPAWKTGEDPGPGGVRVTRRDASGRAMEVLFKIGKDSFKVSGEKLAMAWGRARKWHELKSALFDVERRGGLFVFKGRGLGHGAGLCQWGARARAEAGHGYREILKSYFPDTEIRAVEE